MTPLYTGAYGRAMTNNDTTPALGHELRDLLARHGCADKYESVMDALDTAGVFDPTWSDESDE